MRTARTATGIALATLAALAVATGTAAAYNGGNGTCTGTGTPVGQGPMAQAGTAQGQGFGQGMGRGMGQGAGQRGMGMNLSALPSGTLTQTQRDELASMAEEEKLAHDVYVALADDYPALIQFDRIANAETQHLTSIKLMLDKYDIPDPTNGLEAGEFASDRFNVLYDDLLDGVNSSADALAVGVTIEKADIADLQEALTGLTAPDVTQVYTHLLAGSERHLAAFGG